MKTYRELDTRLTPEQQALKEHVHEFAKSVLRPTWPRWTVCGPAAGLEGRHPKLLNNRNLNGHHGMPVDIFRV
jgi:hypothetical protein